MKDEKPKKKFSKMTTQEFFDSLCRPPEKILSPEQAAEYLGVTRVTLYRLIKSGVIPAKKMGRQWRISKSVLDEIIREGEK